MELENASDLAVTPCEGSSQPLRRGPKTREFVIEDVLINDESDCYVIAEIGHNHQGKLEQCKEMFRSAKECGANAVKLQKRDNRSLFTRQMYDQVYDHRNSYGQTYGQHREFLEFGWDEYVELKRYAREIGITFFATAFDFKSVDFLAKLDMPAFKMASGDLTNTPLLQCVARLKKPTIISTGGGSMGDVERACDVFGEINDDFCLLQCTSGYPVDFSEMNLRVIETYRDRYPEKVIGLSAHDNGIAMAVVAYVLGARVIEKHFTLNRAARGTDHSFSLEPAGLRKMVRDLRRARIAMGDGIKRRYESEIQPMRKMRKKLVAARDLAVGHRLSAEDVCVKSPDDGLPPFELENLVGRTLVRAVREDENLTFDMIQQ